MQLPLVQDLIYASNLENGTNKIYLYSNKTSNDATDFAKVMKKMGGREFDYVKFSGLNTSQLTRFPLGITPDFKDINGQVTTVRNNDSSNDDIDLGTMFNKKAGF